MNALVSNVGSLTGCAEVTLRYSNHHLNSWNPVRASGKGTGLDLGDKDSFSLCH